MVPGTGKGSGKTTGLIGTGTIPG